jgi:hypothetical protein
MNKTSLEYLAPSEKNRNNQPPVLPGTKESDKKGMKNVRTLGCNY